MFLELLLSDTVVVEPEKLRNDIEQEAKNSLEEKYVGKMIRGKGICLRITGFQVSESLIGNSSGNIEISVNFKCVVFSSFRGELLTAKISDMSDSGMTLDHCGLPVFVPKEHLFPNSMFDDGQGCWVWHYKEEEYIYHMGDKVYFLTESTNFSSRRDTF
jgi:DNA-directed RNA polymerase subunit E'/Rpb7